MQALSQVSYTPTGFAVVPDSFIIIAMQGKFVNSFFEKNPTFFSFTCYPLLQRDLCLTKWRFPFIMNIVHFEVIP